jgi:DNA-binding LacI/PurR family transcriptional regulator
MLGGNRAPDHLPQIVDVAGRVDGLIVFAGALSASEVEKVASRIPVVELGGTERSGARTVLVDNYSGMFELARHLVEDHGYCRFAYLGELGTEEFRGRRRGFVDALNAHGVSVPDVLASHPGDDSSAARAIATVLGGPKWPEVIVCDTDQSALADDIAVTGFDGILAGRLMSPALTTVRQPMEQVGRTAVELLARLIDDRKASGHETPLECLPFLGGTCGTH